MTNWGPTGEVVYERTYSRTKPDGTKETWPETVLRVANGNMALVYGRDQTKWSDAVQAERNRLVELMEEFAIIPAGRHLWATGVKGRQYLFNCHVSGWGEKLSDHFEFTFMRLMEGGGVGANYSSVHLSPFGLPRRRLNVHIVCDPGHPDYQAMKDAGLLSDEYHWDWEGAFPVEDSREGWAAALVDLLDTFMTDGEVLHENRVYDVSRVREKGRRLRTFGGVASGPQPFAKMLTEIGAVMNGALDRRDNFYRTYPVERRDTGMVLHEHVTPIEAMEIDHAIAECVVSGGNRRSARMAIVRWDDPFIFDFLKCKQDSGKHWTTNISVEIDDSFLRILKAPLDDFETGNGDPRKVARSVHQAIVTGMLTNGEPGYWNSSLSNEGEPGQVQATNPCGEIALEPWENCNLGHVNLDHFAPKTREHDLDWKGLLEAHRLMTRFLIRATFGDVNDEKQAGMLARNRRIGVGHFGVQGYLAKQGVKFSEAAKNRDFAYDLQYLRAEVREAAQKYAFELRIPEPVKVTTVAPTGTIAKMPGATEGIHPIYARHFIRRVRFSLADGEQVVKVAEFGVQGFNVEQDVYDASGNTAVVEFPTKDPLVAQVEAMGFSAEIVESADEISVRDMLAMQWLYQDRYADNAVSFTVNVPAEPHQLEALAKGEACPPPTEERVKEVSDALIEFLPGLKGTTLMVDGSRPQAPYERITAEQYEAAEAKRIEDAIDLECATGACPVR